MVAVLTWCAAARALESSGLTLETGSPDALCPELEATREIVARRLGALIVDGHKGWRARYTIGHSLSQAPRDFVRLELFNPEGTVELRRDLPIEGDSCRTMSEVIALVLDRHFRGLASSDASPAPSTPVSNSGAGATSVAPARQAPAPASFLGAGPRIAAEYAATVGRPWLGLRAHLGLDSALEVGAGLRLGLTPLEEREPRGARVEARAVAARLSLAYKLPLPVGVLRFGPAVSMTLERASTQGLTYRTDRTRALWMAGVEAGFVLPVSRRLFVEASASFELLLRGVSGNFFVAEQEVLAPRTLTLGGALAFGYAWSE